MSCTSAVLAVAPLPLAPAGTLAHAGGVDAPRDVDIIDTELILSDAQTVESALTRAQYVRRSQPWAPHNEKPPADARPCCPCATRVCGCRRKAKGANADDAARREVLARCMQALEQERPVRSVVWSATEEPLARTVLKDTGLLTAKPVVYVANVDERQMTQLMLEGTVVCPPRAQQAVATCTRC